MVVNGSVYIIGLFTFLIHITESMAYGMRIAGVRTRQIAIAMSFVTSTLLISRLSNMFQAPLLGAMVDSTVMSNSAAALKVLASSFRIIIFAGFLGSFAGAFFTPTAIYLFQKAIKRFLHCGSLPLVVLSVFHPENTWKIITAFRFPGIRGLKNISLKNIPKTFLIINIVVTSVYTIGVLCSLMAGASLPHLRSTASQLSGIVNGIATVLFTLFVDPSGARITDQACHGQRPESDVKSVVFFLQMGRLFGTLVIAQLLFYPFSQYIMWVTEYLGKTIV
ncbi:MAG: DUF2837 family protein [bacterium]|nr:DUF2837 family protein [bacterium]